MIPEMASNAERAGAPRAAAPLFVAGAFRAVELGAADIARLQRFFDDNPEYFVAVSGRPAAPDAAQEEIRGALPQGWPYTRQWILGFVDATDALIGMASVVSDLLAARVWHIGMLVVATRLHGTGVAQCVYDRLEAWARDAGAQWLRLGVVAGNARAERFWARRGFVETRRREGIEMGKPGSTVRVMAKPLAGGTLPEYLARVPRDAPEA
jgi:GNAT superfamily N-acetyltransferase